MRGARRSLVVSDVRTLVSDTRAGKPRTNSLSKEADQISDHQRTCRSDHSHVRLPGEHRTHVAENYPEELAKAVALIMAAPERFHGFDDVFLIGDDWDLAVATTSLSKAAHLERMAQLRPEITETVIKYVRMLHNGMVHPSAAVLARTLRSAEAREEAVKCAERLDDPQAARTRPPSAKQLQRPTTNGRVLRAVDDRTSRGESHCCHGYHVWRLTSAEIGTWQIRGSNTRACLDQALRTTKDACNLNEARCFCSHEVTVFSGHYGVELNVASGEAHSRLGNECRTTALSCDVRGSHCEVLVFHTWFYLHRRNRF